MIHSTTRRNQDFGESQPPRFHSRERGPRKRAEQPSPLPLQQNHTQCIWLVDISYFLSEVLISAALYDKRPKTCAPRRLGRVVSMKEKGTSGQLWGHLKLPT